MNWLDIVIAVWIFVSVVAAAIKGAVRELLSLAALLAGILCGLWYYPAAASYFEPYVAHRGIAGLAAFFLILSVFLAGGWLLTKLAGMLIKAGGLGWADRLLGAAFGLARGVLGAAALVLGMVAFLHDPASSRAVGRSRLAPVVMYCARGLAALAPKSLKDGFEKGMERVRQVWRQEDAV